ncbi:MAG: hypothetical protein AAFX94_04765 [Myxococcota bacterium]
MLLFLLMLTPAASSAPSLETASCDDPTAFAQLIQDPSTLAVKYPGPTAIEQKSKRYWQAAAEVGCARAVTSSDGKVRVWTRSYETMQKNGTSRGEGFLTWTDEKGTYHHVRDAKDLHLDAVIDSISPVPGAPDEYVVLGLRAYKTTFPGDLPRRFALQLKLTDRVEVRNVFNVPGKARSEVLLLAAATPSSGKFRHHAFACQWLTSKGNTIKLEKIPGCSKAGENKTVATWNGTEWNLDKAAASLVVTSWDGRKRSGG